MSYGPTNDPVLICPFRLLERQQVFTDCLHLLSHEPGNELHVVPEVAIPGGVVDYFLVSASRGEPVDLVGIELQTLDTTGTVWPARQRFLESVGVAVGDDAAASKKRYGMNWKMTAKTTLIQLHHKIETFQHVSKHLVLVVQDRLLQYMRANFAFDHLNEPSVRDSMHFHSYALEVGRQSWRMRLVERKSTDASGVSAALGLYSPSRIELDEMLAMVTRKLSPATRWTPV